jgi:hypothetical protein
MALALVSGPAWARPGGGPLFGFFDAVKDFLVDTLGPVVFVIGLALAAYSIFFGNRDGLQRAAMALVAGALLFSADAVADWLQSATR